MSRQPNAVHMAKGVSYLALQTILSSVSKIVAFAIFARIISIEQMGVFTILNVAFGAASAFLSLGISSVVTKFIAEGLAQGDRVRAASVYYKSLILSELTSVLLAAGFLLSKFPAFVSGMPKSPETSMIGVLFAIDIAAYIGPAAAAALYGLFEFRAYALIYGAYTALKPWLVVLLTYRVGSLVGLVEAWVISDTALTIFMVAYLWRKLGPPVFKFETRYLLKLSIPLYVASIASFLYNSFDQLTLIPLVSLSMLGIYGAVVNSFSAYLNLITVADSVLLPVFGGLRGAGGPEALRNAVRKSSRYVSIVTVPMAFALLATARPALTLFVGTQYSLGAIPLGVLALGSVAIIFSLLVDSILIVENETMLAALTSLLPIPLSVAVALILIPAVGILGAAIARAVSMIFGLSLTWYFVQRKFPVSIDSEAVTKSLVASGVMGLAMGAMQLVLYSRFLLPVYLVVGLVTYLLTLKALKAINSNDMDLFRQIVGPRFSWVCKLLELLTAQ